jgi:hypothetical protein
MKTILSLFFALALAVCCCNASEYLVVVPARGLSPQCTKAVLSGLVMGAIERLPAGTQIRVIDPVSLDLVASVSVPEGTKAQRERNLAFARQIGPLRAALTSLTTSQSWETLSLRIPETLRFLAEQVVPHGQRATVLFIGSPLYRSGAGTFDFANGVVPSDGWLSAPAEDSPFAMAGISCRGWSIHPGFPRLA